MLFAGFSSNTMINFTENTVTWVFKKNKGFYALF